jgi:addiction module HigA family antidote
LFVGHFRTAGESGDRVVSEEIPLPSETSRLGTAKESQVLITKRKPATVREMKRKPATVREILNAEFIAPLALSQGAVADAMGAARKHVNELCNDRRKVAARTALILGRVFGNSAEFWLNVQRRSDLWEAMNSATDKARVERARPLSGAA